MSSTPVTPAPVVPVVPKPAAPAATAPVVTKPVTPVTAVSIVEKDVKAIGVWLTPAHIVLLTLIGISSFFGLYMFESKGVEIAQVKLDAATTVNKQLQASAASDAIKNQANQVQNQATQTAMAAAEEQLAQANAQLTLANKQLTAALAAKQAQVALMTPTQQATEWQTLVPGTTVAVTPTGVALDPASATKTVQALEELPADRKSIANLETLVANDDKRIADEVVALQSEKAAHASDVANDAKALAASKGETKQVSDDFSLYKKKAHRNYLRAFGLGFVTGLVTGHALGL